MLVSVHIPKCAGTSFRHILREVYDGALWLNYGTIFVRSQARASLIPSGTVCIHGHFFADAFDDVLPDRRLITWLRHPVERVISNYFHFLRSPDMRDDCCRLLHERNLSLVKFAELDWMRDEATHYLSGKSLDDFEFVGIAERFSESLELLAAQIGWRSAIPMRRDNVNPDRVTDRYVISARDYEKIAALNAADMEMYNIAVATHFLDMGRVLVPEL
jgi:hypothetical protein